MPILYKCPTCGKACKAENPGELYTCSCGACSNVPQDSEADCVCVYKDGFPNEGMPITLTELGKQVTAGQFGPLDLILHNGVWQPLNMVFEIAAVPEVEVDSKNEIALKLEELPPAPNFSAKGNSGGSLQGGPMKDFWHWFKRFQRFRYKSPLGKCVYLLFVAVVAFGIYVGIVGKVVNRLLWHPAYVTVYNDSQQECIATLGSRKISISGKGVGTFQDIFVSLPTTRRLKLKTTSGNGETKTANVPVCPGVDVVVNLAGEGVFGEYNMSECAKLSLRNELEQQVGREIIQGQGPDSVGLVQKELHILGNKVFNGNIDEPILTSRQYDLSRVGIVRSAEDSQHVRRVGREGRPKVYLNDSILLEFKNASVAYREKEHEVPCKFEVRFEQKFMPFDVMKDAAEYGRKLKISEVSVQSCPANVTYDKEGSLCLVLGSMPGFVNYYVADINKAMDFKGNWSYTASLSTRGVHAGKWMWKWQYSGAAVQHAKNRAARQLSMTFVHDYEGKTSFSIK